ncbi:MAG TPA: hypothetical protein VHN80_31505, partial [Kineosporiaceae bacterium]|nr:hypothetical protein [Kineosporiaceae bacterium]
GVKAITKEVSIFAGFIYVSEFPQAIALLAAGAVEVDSLTSAIEPLERFADAFEVLRNPDRSIKVLIGAGPGAGAGAASSTGGL